ncbi:hypothetical protein [Vallitalea sp.]|jgi:DNA-directed RNA polymerase specialized sigma24 family protein|uniref:hypothetical protein n=1 Tax=Vallitalea sp. TaxID=1882829 RepID=UPI0025F8644A|nr:hypothetical protein [Vallitalea sp.]MCT4686360.1 hypothetical protein [Vallitalea sp.]
MNILYCSYEDLLKRISVIEIRLESYKKEKELLVNVSENEKQSVIKVNDERISYMTYLQEIKIIDSHILLHEEELIRLKKEKEKIDTIMSGLEGTNESVFYYRIVKGMTQEQTAEKLYMSTRQVQRIEKKLENSIMAC